MKKVYNNLTSITLPFVLLISICSCNSQPNYCALPQAQEALKEALIEKMIVWQDNAEWAKIEDFENRINKIIEESTISEYDVIEEIGFGILDAYKEAQNVTGNSCSCEAKFQFQAHDRYMEVFADSVNRIVKEEHRFNRAYMNVDKQINYVGNNGFVFEYILIMDEDSTFYVPEFYPDPTQDQIDNVGGLLYEYLNEHEGL